MAGCLFVAKGLCSDLQITREHFRTGCGSVEDTQAYNTPL